MANANDIMGYLPVSFKSTEEQNYINFLWESYESNYNNDKYPFAFIAFHMLYMSFVYFEVWQIKESRRTDFEKAMIGFNKEFENLLINATTPFAFVELGESNFIRFLKLIGCDNSQIGNYTASVKSRNDAAHSNGRIFFNDQTIIDRKIDEILRCTDDIQTHSQPVLEECLIKFLKENHNSDRREYIDDSDQIREILIYGNYLSQKDIEFMLTFDIATLSTKRNYAEMKALYDVFKENYTTA
ncbi:MAG: hypothetical protein AAB347_14305 [Bacteroidota bacterium]